MIIKSIYAGIWILYEEWIIFNCIFVLTWALINQDFENMNLNLFFLRILRRNMLGSEGEAYRYAPLVRAEKTYITMMKLLHKLIPEWKFHKLRSN